MRKITQFEIEKLYAFTRQHYVEYVDLQTELVDHLAHAIEARWEKDSTIEFEENLQLEFKKFGVFGFSQIVEKRQQAMSKKYVQLLFKEVLASLRSSTSLLLVLLVTTIFTFLLNTETGFNIMYGIIVFVAIVATAYIFRRVFSVSKNTKKNAKKYLLEELIENTRNINLLLLVPFYIMNMLEPERIVEKSLLFCILFSLFVCLVYLCTYVCFFVLPQKKEEILMKIHPERRFL